MAGRRQPKDKTEVSWCIKYLLFFFNVFFWLLGVGVMAIGIWAWVEKQMFEKIGEITNVFLDPGLILMIVGAVIFIIGFTGCIGALRENTCLLMFFMVTLIVILLLQITCAVLLFVYRSWVTEQVSGALKDYIPKYRDDEDLQNIIDWVQDTWLHCCGVQSPDDWNSNEYFNCSSPSRERCGVPFSCCKPDESETVINLQCGYDVRSDKSTQANHIYTDGCITAVDVWIDANMISVAGTAVGIAVAEIIGILLANNLRIQVRNDNERRARRKRLR